LPLVVIGSFKTGIQRLGAPLGSIYSWEGTADAGQLKTMFDLTLMADKLTFATGDTGWVVEFVDRIASAPIAILRYSVPNMGT
jgi:hypothetical protein